MDKTLEFMLFNSPIPQIRKLRNGGVNWLFEGQKVNTQGFLNWNLWIAFYILSRYDLYYWKYEQQDLRVKGFEKNISGVFNKLSQKKKKIHHRKHKENIKNHSLPLNSCNMISKAYVMYHLLTPTILISLAISCQKKKKAVHVEIISRERNCLCLTILGSSPFIPWSHLIAHLSSQGHMLFQGLDTIQNLRPGF